MLRLAISLMINSGSLNTYWAKHELPIPASIGVPFDSSLFARDGASFSLSSGVLPPGLTLSSRGDILGPPTTAGVYTFTVRLDASGGDFGIGVGHDTASAGYKARISRCPAGLIGAPYFAQLQGSRSAPGDSLPPGLTLSA